MTANRNPIDDPPPVPPVRPDSGDCCQSGCNPCIFDLYQDALERYRIEHQAWEKRKSACRNAGRKKK